MRIEIDPDKLFDSTYNQSMDGLFSFDQDAIDDLVQDIKFGKPTCYLISGYRGAGKSSFIKKVESEIEAKKNPSENKKIVFVHTNFSRYKSQDYLLRKLIRGLYQNLVSDEHLKDFKQLKDREKTLSDDKKIASIIEKLYDQTFHEIVHSLSNQKQYEKTTELKTDLLELASLVLIFFVAFSNITWFNSSFYLNAIAAVGAFLLAGKKIFSLTRSDKKVQSESIEFNRKTLYDNEISDYHFFNVVNGLANNSFKVVFVLDELDKVEETEVNKLIQEMKPYLVSGVASFIVVAGQQLYYKYHSSETDDDAPLTTLFSRTIHIPLMSSYELPLLFGKILLENKDKSAPFTFSDEWKPYVDYLIFKSKRVPRKFMNIIRQNITWEDGKAFLEINKKEEELKTYKTILASITQIDDKEISVKFTGALRDFYNMQLFIRAEKILTMSSKNVTFSIKELE
jgi:hypothetical protein